MTSDKKQIQKTQLMQSESGNFFERISIEFLIHELKNPIAVAETSVKSIIDKQENFGLLNARQERILNRALRNTRKARELLYHLLEVGRGEARCVNCHRFNPLHAFFEVMFDVLETVGGTGFDGEVLSGDKIANGTFFSEFGIFTDFPDDTSVFQMYQDEVKYRQILGNLLKNAMHYRKERLTIRAGQSGNIFFMEIKDDGPGISPDYHDSIFQRYTQVNALEGLARNGHGLGLAGARILARGMGGDIEVESEKGKGATFRLTLPQVFDETP